MRVRGLALCALVAAGCSDSAATGPANGSSGNGVIFTEVAYDREDPFVHHSGAAGEFLLPEIMGGGAGFLDYDGDTLLDLYLIDSGRLDGAGGAAFRNRLYHNEGNGQFEDVTAAAGVGGTGRRPQDAGVRGKTSYGMGCSAGDYDNDADVDLYVTNLGPNVLYRNNGDGTFSDVTAHAGVGDPSWSMSSAFVDYDADGDLDLFVTNYVDWSGSPRFTERRCYAPSGVRDYCSPQAYSAPTTDTLYRNNGDGTFSDVSAEAGIRTRAGTGLGVVCTDLNGDGRVDIYVANDQMPSFAWINSGDGRFTESAAQLGCAVNEMGKSQAGMGVASADLEDDGDFDLWKVHLHRESHILYINRGGYFDDATSAWGLAAPTRRFTGFGTALFDYDLDGLLDTFVASGRVQIVADTTFAADVYAEPNQLLRQVEEGRFEDVTALAGPALELVENSRAAAFGDYDNDGDIDILVANRDGPARLLRNDAPRLGNFLSLRVLDGHGRDALGATVRCIVGDRVRTAEVRSAWSYCASNDPRVHLGLDPAARVDRVEVRWPAPEGSGAGVETFGPFEANQHVVLRPGGADGVARKSPQAAPAPHAEPSSREEFLAIAERLRESRNPYFGQTQVRDLQAQLASSGGDPAERVRGMMILSMELLRMGEVDAACTQIEEATGIVRSSADLDSLMQGLHRIRGIVYLRKAELENCIRRHSAECCIFPLRGGGVHEVKTPAQLALQSYQSFLERDPGDLKIRWLLNLAHMAYGNYPAGVPEPYLIPPATFESDYAIPRFPDVGPSLGVDAFNLAGGCVADDFDGDGFLDIVTSTWDPSGPLIYYRNSGAGGFEDRSAASRLDEQLGGLNLIGGDHDGDGDGDLLVLRGGWLFDDGQIRNSLLRNNGDGTWSDVTRAAGLADPPRPTQTATWGDFDNDGDLDLFVGNESRLETGPPVGDYPCQLFDNNGDGTFTDVAQAAGVRNDRFTKGVTAGDYDNDGDLDLYLSNIGLNRLYRNNGDGTFTDVAPQAGVTEPSGRSFATWFFDYDNDGWLDLWVGAFDATVDDVAADCLGLPRKGSEPRMYHNNGDGTFTSVTAEMELAHSWLPMGANFGDLDHDGFLDFYLGTGDPDFQTLMPNVMLRNDGGRRFQDVTTAGGFGHLQKGHGVAFADLDNDGDQDIYHQLGGFYPGDAFANALFLNPGSGNHFLYVKLIGTKSNRSGAGARIKVEIETPGGARREIHRAAGSVSSFGGSPSRQEIGLGDARRITSLEVFWPASGTRQIFTDVPLDTLINVTEGAAGFETEKLQSLRFDS